MVKSEISERTRLLLLAGEMAGAGALVVILLVFIASTLDGYLIRKGEGAAVITSALFDLTNTDRRVNKLNELIVDPQLSKVAQAKANDMASKGYFAHVSPEGHSPWYWFKQNGYAFTYAGENLAVDFSDSADVERAWMNSPTHRANILNGQFTRIGLATAVGQLDGRETVFVVQTFATPAHEKMPDTLTPTELNAGAKPTEIALATTKPRSSPPKTVAVKPSATDVSPVASTSPASSTVLGSSVEGLIAPAQPKGLGALWNDFAASPRSTLRYAYFLFALLIIIALIIETGVEIRRHHMRHVVLVLLLLVFMSGLFLVADSMVFTDPIIAEAGAVYSL